MGTHAGHIVRLLGFLVLVCIIIPVGQAVDPLWTVPASPGEALSTVAISHDGSTIIAGGTQLISISPEGKKLWAGWSGTALGISRDGGYIVAAQGQIVQLFSQQGILLWQQSLGDTVTGVSLSPDAALVVAGGGSTMQSWYNSGSGLGKNTTETVQDIEISPVKDQIIVCTAKALRSFNTSYVPNWYDDSISPAAVGISGDGTGIVVSNGNHIRMYHGSGTLLWDKAFAGGNILSLAYSWDGSTLVAGRDDSSVIVTDREGNLLWTANAGYWVTSVGVSDDGSVIATGSIDNQVHIYNRQGTLLGASKTENPIKSRSVAVSGDGSLIVAVDSSKVYGFSGMKFPAPVAATTETPAGTGVAKNITAGPPQENSTVITSLPGGGPSLPGTPPGLATGTSPSTGFPCILVLLALAILFIVKRR